MKTYSLTSVFLALVFALSQPATLSALPVDLSVPPGGLGPTSDQGYATHWIEMTELDFGQGLTLPVRLGFLTGRTAISVNFGTAPWRVPLLNSRVYDRTAASWKVLLPCGRIMTLLPQADKPGQWGTADGEWQATQRLDKHTLVSRADGWELEFDRRDFLIRLRADSGRQVIWNRDQGGSVLTLVEQPADPAKPATLGFTVLRDQITKLISGFQVRTAYGMKSFDLAYDEARRLSAVSFPDTTAHKISYATSPEGHPSMTVIGRDLIPTSLTWHKEARTLLSDGVWTYTITPQQGTNPVMTRVGPQGETEIQHDDAANARSLFTSADGTQTIRQKVKGNTAAKGKLESITRILPENSEPRTANREQVIYQAKYDPRGLLIEETDALSRKTTHSYQLHGSNIHLGIKQHITTNPLGDKTIQEFDKRGNLTASINALGHVTHIEYDAQNRLVKATGTDGTVVEAIAYNQQGRITTHTDALGAVTKFGYDKDGNRITSTNALGHVTREEFNQRGLRTHSIDALGHVTTFEYDAGGRLSQFVVPALAGSGKPAVTHFTYDDHGRRLTMTDPAGNTTSSTYDKLGRLTSRTDALGRATKYEYDVKHGSTGCISCSISGLPTRITSPSGRITERRYDADRHLIEETIGLSESAPSVKSADTATAKHSYDLTGNLLTTTDPLGRVTRHEYNAANQKIKTVFPDKTQRTFTHNALGQLTAETDELGHITQRDYDAYGNLIALTNPEGGVTRTEFEAPAPSEKNQNPVNPGNLVNPVSKGYAALHRPTAIVTPSGSKTTFEYDLLGRKIATTKGAGTKLAATTHHVFDAVGNEIESSTPTGQRTKHEYDTRNRRTRTQDALNRAWTFLYNDNAGPSGPAPCCGADPTSNSRAAATQHPDGSKETRITDAAGQLISTTDAKGDTVKYAYDPDGRLIELTDAKGSITRWRHDARGKLTAKTYPDKSTELYEHDLAGQMTRRVRPDGTAATYNYSERGRLLTIMWSDGKTEPSTFAYDAAGHMTLAQNKSATINRSYSAGGKLEKEIEEITALENPVKTEVGYAYNPEGHLASLTYPDKSTVAYQYNARGELSEVIDVGSTGFSRNQESSFKYERRQDGKTTQLTLPNGTKTTKSYDAVGRLQTIAHLAPDGSVLESETSRYDLRNRRTARVHADGSTDLFRYDPAGQVTAAAYGNAGVPAVDTNQKLETLNFEPSQTFQYDPAGNRIEVTDAGMTTKYQSNEANQYTRIESADQSVIVEPSFDPLGNLLQDDRNTYTWDADIHLLSVESKAEIGKQKAEIQNTKSAIVRFRYDALHRRVARIESHQTTLFTHDGWNVITEHQASLKPETSNLKLSAKHIWGEDLSGSLQGAGGIGGLLSSVLQPPSTTVNNSKPPSTVPVWFHYDSNGNVLLLTNSQGQESARYRYDAFGKTLTATGIAASINRYRFSTKPVEMASGLAYYGYRYYSPESGRWTARDKIGERGGINLFVQAHNNLINRIDILGNEDCDEPFMMKDPDCIEEAQKGYDKCMRRAQETRDVGLSCAAVACGLSCLLSGPLYVECVIICLGTVAGSSDANYYLATKYCKEDFDEAKQNCGCVRNPDFD